MSGTRAKSCACAAGKTCYSPASRTASSSGRRACRPAGFRSPPPEYRNRQTAVRRTVEDFKAKLAPVTATRGFRKPQGKAERKAYADGGAAFDVKARRLDLPDGATVEILLDDQVLGSATVTDGRARFNLTSENGDTVPRVSTGQTIGVRHEDVPPPYGVFEPD